MKISNERELQSIAINHSANTDYKDFIKIYRQYTKEPFSITSKYRITSKWSSNIQKKSFNTLIKMTAPDQLKILADKIKANQTQYDLNREAAKISALSSKNLKKYEYLTGEDLWYRPSRLEKAKFEYSLLGMVFTTNTKSKTNKDKVYNKNKQCKYLVFDSQHSFVKFKDINEF